MILYFLASPSERLSVSEMVALSGAVIVMLYSTGGSVIVHDVTHVSSNTSALSASGRYSYRSVPESLMTNDSPSFDDENVIVLVFW